MRAGSNSASSVTRVSPFTSPVQTWIPTARTRGAVDGPSISPAAEASARWAATIVAVAPTLVARSQLSLSVRIDMHGSHHAVSKQYRSPSYRLGRRGPLTPPDTSAL